MCRFIHFNRLVCLPLNRSDPKGLNNQERLKTFFTSLLTDINCFPIFEGAYCSLRFFPSRCRKSRCLHVAHMLCRATVYISYFKSYKACPQFYHSSSSHGSITKSNDSMSIKTRSSSCCFGNGKVSDYDIGDKFVQLRIHILWPIVVSWYSIFEHDAVHWDR